MSALSPLFARFLRERQSPERHPEDGRLVARAGSRPAPRNPPVNSTPPPGIPASDPPEGRTPEYLRLPALRVVVSYKCRALWLPPVVRRPPECFST